MFTNLKTKVWKDKEVLLGKDNSNAWSDSSQNEQIPDNTLQQHFPLIKSISNQDLNSLWQRTMVVEVSSNDFDWKEVGIWIMDKLGWSLGFHLQPIDECKAVFTIKTNAEFSRVSKIEKWKIEDIEVHLYPWFAGINAIIKPKQKEINQVWIGVGGVPFNLWEYSTFKAIRDKFGGLVEVFPETTMATDLFEIRVKVNGPVSSGVWCEDLILVNTKF
ncbi:hypothetical protein MKX03_013924 [Papaver bracteatum]|nr:hypothetical protein MKX03_013924 [Papaver bracteatum]